MSERKKHTKKARAREKKVYHRRSREEFEEEDEEFEEEEEEEEITQNTNPALLPIIQNAPKTPTPPHRASCAPWATVGTRFTFVAAQCVRGTNVFNTSLIVVVVLYVPWYLVPRKCV